MTDLLPRKKEIPKTHARITAMTYATSKRKKDTNKSLNKTLVATSVNPEKTSKNTKGATMKNIVTAK